VIPPADRPGALQDALRAALPAPVVREEPVGGGMVADAHLLHLADGTRRFVKRLPDAPIGFFAAEARGLAWLADAGALGVPAVEAHARPDQGGGFILMQAIDRGEHPGPAGLDALGQGLAALHAAGAPGWGLDHDNFLGTLPQANHATPEPSWAAFLRERRLRPLTRRATDAGLLDPPLRSTLDRVIDRTERLVGDPEPPARLHGDLWSGNAMFDRAGRPWIYDPAAYGGHREVDLAMMALFGGFSDRVFDAYAEATPLQPGWRQRRPLYQLPYLLVHLILFGESYRSQVAAAARALA